jgi:glyoxylase-like metal-dependent hydrolase (beta-lactamase superfamily II)
MIRKIGLGAFIALMAAFAGSTSAQDRFADVKVTAAHVAGKVYVLKGSGGNIGVSIGEDGMIIVDDQFAPLADKIRAALKELGPGDIEFILNTHWHGDHTGGNVVFGPEATIIAHEHVRKRLAAGSDTGDRKRAPEPKEALPVITFGASLSIHFNGEEIKAVHLPKGHTDGDCIVHFTGSNVVHMGDQFFAARFPFVDIDSGGDVQGLIDDVGKVIKEMPADIRIIPGHGEVSTLKELKEYHAMLLETTATVRRAMTAGQTVDQAKAAGLLDTWSSWSHDFVTKDRWIETIYRSYAK